MGLLLEWTRTTSGMNSLSFSLQDFSRNSQHSKTLLETVFNFSGCFLWRRPSELFELRWHRLYHWTWDHPRFWLCGQVLYNYSSVLTTHPACSVPTRTGVPWDSSDWLVGLFLTSMLSRGVNGWGPGWVGVLGAVETLLKAQQTQGIEYFDSSNTFSSKQKLQQSLKSWSNFSLVSCGKVWEIQRTTLTNHKSM